MQIDMLKRLDISLIHIHQMREKQRVFSFSYFEHLTDVNVGSNNPVVL